MSSIIPRDIYIEKRYNYVSSGGVNNSCVILRGNPIPIRARAEMLIFKDDRIYLLHDVRSNRYSTPGGGLEPDETFEQAAIRESIEESRNLVKDVFYCSTRVSYTEKPAKWVKENIPKEDWWYGYYTDLYAGTYNGKYDGFIKKIDRDDIMFRFGKFYKIDKVYNKLPQYYKDAINEFRRR